MSLNFIIIEKINELHYKIKNRENCVKRKIEDIIIKDNKIITKSVNKIPNKVTFLYRKNVYQKNPIQIREKNQKVYFIAGTEHNNLTDFLNNQILNKLQYI